MIYTQTNKMYRPTKRMYWQIDIQDVQADIQEADGRTVIGRQINKIYR